MKISSRVRQRRKRESEARAERILAGAERVFARHGISNATMQMIAREAKVAVGTIYLHFHSRDEVYLELAVAGAERLLLRLREAKSRNSDTLEQLRALAKAYVDHYHDSRYSFLLSSTNVASIRKRISRASELRKFNRATELRVEIIGTVEDTMRKALDSGLILNRFGPIVATALLWSTLKGALELAGDSEFWCQLTGLAPEEFAQQIVESLITNKGAATLARDLAPNASNHHTI